MKLELLYFHGCPNADRARALLAQCLTQLGLSALLVEREGDFPSPSIQVNGIDVMGPPPVSGRFCRLDVPTEERVLAVLRGAMEKLP